MNHEAMLQTYDRQMRCDAQPDGAGVRVERVGNVIRQVGPEHAWNGVLWTDLDADTADEAIAAQVAFFSAMGREFEWTVYSHDRPEDLSSRLLAAGFVAEPPETLMIARIADLPTEVQPPEGIHFRPITDPAGLELMAEVQEQAFGARHPQSKARLLAQLTEQPDTVVAVLAMAGDLPVSGARMELPAGKEFAGLWGGGTVPGWRGKGVYRALVAYRARIAAERGYRYLQVDASDQSRPILERLGFRALATTTPYIRQP